MVSPRRQDTASSFCLSGASEIGENGIQVFGGNIPCERTQAMKRLAIISLSALLTLSAVPDAFGWGAVSGPRGGAAYRGPMGGAAPCAPLPALLPSERPPVLLRLAVPMAEPQFAAPSMAAAPYTAAQLSSPRASATASRPVLR